MKKTTLILAGIALITSVALWSMVRASGYQINRTPSITDDGTVVVIEGTPGAVVGGFASGSLRVTSTLVSVNANSVITGHSLFAGNKQLWYLGSLSSSSDDIGFLNRQNGSLSFFTNNTQRVKIEAAGNVGIGESLPATLLQLTGTTTPTIFIESSTASDGGRIILEDTDGAGCTAITVLDGVISGATIACP